MGIDVVTLLPIDSFRKVVKKAYDTPYDQMQERHTHTMATRVVDPIESVRSGVFVGTADHSP